jgi:hypothetical protein
MTKPEMTEFHIMLPIEEYPKINGEAMSHTPASKLSPLAVRALSW